MPRRATSLALAGITALMAPLAAQQPQPIGRAAAEFVEPFTRISGMRELADGKVIVSDQREKLVQLIDLRTGTATNISREGSGPGEYALPTALFAQPNDQTLLVDLLNRRFLRIGPDGKALETVSPPQLSAPGGPGGGGMRISGLVNPRGVDSQGRLYFQDLGIGIGGESPDSVAILRWAPGATRVDTAGWVRGPKTTTSTVPASGGGSGMRFTVGGSMVWAPAEQWAVSGTGMIARVTPEPYRVIWYGTNRRATPGPTVAYTPMRVTEADKAEYREAQSVNPPTMIMMTAGGSGGATMSAPAAPQLPEPTFAETKPAFTGSGSVQATPEGEVWVLRTRPAGDKIPVYDVFDNSGRLVRKVSLAARSRVVGFGRTSVYVARMDADDLEYLQRYTRPAVGQP